MAAQRRQQLGATLAIYKGHAAFLHPELRKFGVLHADFRIHQRPAHAVYRVLFHRPARHPRKRAIMRP